jgi:hypothetical protein
MALAREMLDEVMHAASVAPVADAYRQLPLREAFFAARALSARFTSIYRAATAVNGRAVHAGREPCGSDYVKEQAPCEAS